MVKRSVGRSHRLDRDALPGSWHVASRARAVYPIRPLTRTRGLASVVDPGDLGARAAAHANQARQERRVTIGASPSRTGPAAPQASNGLRLANRIDDGLGKRIPGSKTSALRVI